jgi:hypothetical protein
MTWVAIPSGIEACPWRIPSNIQISPNETLNSLRATGSGWAKASVVGAPSALGAARRNWADRKTLQEAPTNSRITAATNPWRRSSL